MDRATVIITVYGRVVEHYRQLTQPHPLRHGGFAPQLPDAEGITREICGEDCKLQSDQDSFADFHPPSQPFFPQLSDRTPVARQAANLRVGAKREQQGLERDRIGYRRVVDNARLATSWAEGV